MSRKKSCRLCSGVGIACTCLVGIEILKANSDNYEELILWRWTPGVYFIEGKTVNGPIIKIGITDNLEGRFRSLALLSPATLHLRAFHPCKSRKAAQQLELDYHKQFIASRSHGEWFVPSEKLQQLIEKPISSLNHPKKPREEWGYFCA